MSDERLNQALGGIGRVLAQLGRELEELGTPALDLADGLARAAEREAVVAYLNRRSAEAASQGITWASAADAIKAGLHHEPLGTVLVKAQAQPEPWVNPLEVDFPHEDQPDPAQAPSNPQGTGPVPLFIDGDEDEDYRLPDEQPRPGPENGIGAQLEKAYADLAYVAPELWSVQDAQMVRTWHEYKGEPMPAHIQAHIEKIERAADAAAHAELEREARRLIEQERAGG